MERLAAAIDIGTYTARMLVAEVLSWPRRVCEIERARRYIQLGELLGSDEVCISDAAFERTVEAVRSFQKLIEKYSIDRPFAVATGVLRLAVNGLPFLRRLKEETGLEVELISGETEARLSALGVETGLSWQGRDAVIFDLGGGSTEFFIRENNAIILKSIPVGAMMLTKRFLQEDPPSAGSLASLSGYLEVAFSTSLEGVRQSRATPLIAGTGGTAVTLACMKEGLNLDKISSSLINGTVLKRSDVDALCVKLGSMSLRERAALDCLDNARAFVILAGCLAVSRLLHVLKAEEMAVSMSDLLEGILIERCGGKTDD